MRMTVCCVGCNSNSNVPSWRVWMDTCDGMFSAEFECWRRCHLNIMWHHIVRRTKRRCSFCPLCECAGVDADEHVLRYVSLMRWYESWATRWCILINSSTHRILRTRWCFFIRFVDERILIKMFSVCLPFWISYKWKRCLTTRLTAAYERTRAISVSLLIWHCSNWLLLLFLFVVQMLEVHLNVILEKSIIPTVPRKAN